MAKLRLGRAPWTDREAPRFPRHRGDLSVDVVIVGGGITGAIAAYTFANAGVSVALIEAKRIGRGSTAASTALLMQEPDKDLRELAARYGRRAARRIWRAIGDATRDLIALIRRLRISCELQVSDSIYFTTDAGRVGDLRREFEARRDAKLGGRWLAAGAIARQTGIPAAAGIRTSGNALLNPYAACVGFVECALARGARVFEYSQASRVRQVRGGIEVRTDGGKIRANCVLVTTGYATREFKRLAGRFRMMNTYVIGTVPLTAPVRRRLPPADVMLWDTEQPYHYFRWTDDRRILFGGADKPHKSSRSRHDGLREGRDALCRVLGDLYPVLAGCNVAYSWEGLFAQTPDGLPYIGSHQRYPRHLFALGYGGNGMSVAHLAAQMLLRRYTAKSTADDELFAFGRTRRGENGGHGTRVNTEPRSHGVRKPSCLRVFVSPG
jgi:glycine/D-amino acid oxidase-like deaminating enzyme